MVDDRDGDPRVGITQRSSGATVVGSPAVDAADRDLALQRWENEGGAVTTRSGPATSQT
ncbi:hypothetical protein [Pseudonocardia dioxanivorans]|uniref:hypothetical protein n=1 Tax=Pseudonocardia dioxanivorans TaxID=240495 RepID=UPI00131A5C80|nr:hypothetical protein [Pseudonocardia dioxanivorans]